MKLSEKLMQLRRQSGMTQDELAAKLFVTRTAVSKWENDKGYPGIDSLKLLSQVYGVSIDDLISEEDVASAQSAKRRRTRIFYWCAVACLALAAAFALATALSSVPWLCIPSVAAALGYVAFGLLSKPALSGLTRADRVRHIVSRVAAVIIVLAVLVATLVQQLAA